MTMGLLIRRLLACLLAVNVAAAGVPPRCEATPAPADAPRPCCCGCPGQCLCGTACACLTDQPSPVRPALPEKSNDLRLVLGLNAATALKAAAEPIAVQGSVRPATTLALFPSLRALEVRIQT